MLIASDLARMIDPVLFARACGIEPDPWQADLLRSSAQRVLLLASRQSGKSTTTALKAFHRAVYEPGATIVIVSPSQTQSGEMLRTIKRLHGNLDGAPAFIGDSVLKVDLANGSRIKALPGTEKTIRGYGGVSLVIIDEASRVPDEILAAVRPMLATRSDGSLIALTTPNGKRGFFYESWEHGHRDAWHRIRVPASACPRISQAHLDEELRELGPIRFSEEYGLEFHDATETAFSTAIIDAAFTDEFKALWI